MIKSTSKPTPYKTEFTNGKVSSFSDNTPDKGGNADGFRPHELLEAAFANCMNMSVRMFADSHSIPLDAVSTVVNLDRNHPDNVCFEYRVELSGNLTEAQNGQIMEMLETCPVRQTLSKSITFRQG
ncbi:OsmC family protein [Vibrio salinus]|uniref:OsmC family protein n=1 Tax=Vibrio salinus TaxID=2899784 RepID=UPI001E486DC6|nr:OsmC family protein [Vibrio salinus]MCE0492688.1 OsmC family protein [Vibrio salinus]